MSDTIERLRTALREQYAVDRQVGEGGMATVYLATDLKHHRKVAIKVLRPELAASIGGERFLREIEVSAGLQHPHIVPLYDSGQRDGFLYYVMPFLEGESLRDLLQRSGRMPLARAAEIVREAASGLSYAHQQGIVHRDIKPENIMLSAGHAVVTDFGIARAIDASRPDHANITGTGIAIGTPAYMSPEQATADEVDARSDQYSLACVFYEMVTGKQAFTGKTMQAMLTSMLTGPRPKLTQVVATTPPGVDAATQRALSADPSGRFPDIMTFAHAVGQESTGAAAATRESRRWKRLAIALPLVVVAAGAVWVALFGVPGRVVLSGAETIAVVPFSTSGAAADGLGEGIVDLLAGNLDGVGPIRAIEPRSILREWRRRVKPGESFDVDDALSVGRTLKAGSVLTGSIVATGTTARLLAQLLDMHGNQLATAQVDGPVDSVLVLTDQLTLRLLQGIWKSREPLPSANASGITSTSMPAIRAYLDGERFHRRGQWDSAQTAFERAVAADSTFALAWYKLANTMGWIGSYNAPLAIQSSHNAVRYADRLPPRTRRIVVAYELFQQGDVAAIDSMKSYTASFPDDADGWYLLGEAQYHSRLYRPRPTDELAAPFDRVLAIDSTLTPAAIHPTEMAVAERDSVRVQRYLRVFTNAGATGEAERARAALIVATGQDTVGVVALVGNGRATSGMTLAALSARSTRADADPADLEALMRQMVGALSPQARTNGLVAWGMLAGGLGQQERTRAIADTLRPFNPELAQFVTMAPVYGAFASDSVLARFAMGLAGAPPGNPFVYFLRALVALDRRLPAEAVGYLRAAAALPDSAKPPMIRGALVALDGLRMVAEGDTVRGLAKADSGLRIPAGLGNFSFSGPVALRVALARAASPRTRDAAIVSLRYGFSDRTDMTGILPYWLGRAYEADGDTANAVASYARFTRLWSKADQVYAPRVAEVKSVLQRLTGEKVP
jgi:serine/threonine-protein kinase